MSAVPPPTTADAGEPLSDRDYQALGAFRSAMREFLAFSEEGAEEQGLTSQQHQALLAIRTHTGGEAMTIGELANCLLIKHHSAIGLIARLIEGGFVDRRPSEIDRRRVLVALTMKGSAALEKISVRNLGQLKLAARILQQVSQTARALEPRPTKS
jgi:DNA-binding MarR family transcriptional regulator